MKIKHLIITRFLNQKMNLGDKILDRETIDNGIKVLKQYLLPSLEAQSNKNFTWIILINPEVNKEYIQELYNLNTSFETIVDEQDSANLSKKDYLLNAYRDYDYVITSRIDYDDMIYYHAVDDVQSSISDNLDKPIYCYSFKNGLMYNINTDLYTIFDNDYPSGGGIAILLSLIVNTSIIKKNLQIYDFSHVATAKNIQDNYSRYGDFELNYYPRVLNELPNTFVYVRHNFTDSQYGKHKYTDIRNFNKNQFLNIK